MLPVPKHLQAILHPIGEDNSEFELTGRIICTCGADRYKIKLVGDDSNYATARVITVAEIDNNYFLIVSIACHMCTKEHLLFDNHLHGWNGFVCGGDSKNKPRPEARVWKCACGAADHAMTVSIRSQGPADFQQEACDHYDASDWVEAFAWITMATECRSCGRTNEEWISYETM